jgi:hypothetical protein
MHDGAAQGASAEAGSETTLAGTAVGLEHDRGDESGSANGEARMTMQRRLGFLLGTPAWVIAYVVVDSLFCLELESWSTPGWVYELRWHPYAVNWVFTFVDRLCVLSLLSLPFAILAERFYGRYALYAALVAAALVAYGQATYVADNFNLPAPPVHRVDWARVVASLVVLPGLVIFVRRLRSNIDLRANR